jgi:hypothetical protein
MSVKAIALAVALALSGVQASAQAFSYHKILSPNQIPGTGGATVSALYSPAVFKHGPRYYMLFGVSLSCRNGTVSRDSIAYAVSYDGVSNWVYMGYLIEPNTTVCLLDTSQWLTGALYQVNDPAVRVENGQLHVAYTSVFWKYPYAGVECGALGTATFDLSKFPLGAPTYRNNQYLVPTAAQCQAGGFSRPAFYKPTGQAQTEIWFDGFGQKVSRVAAISNTVLSNAAVQTVGAFAGSADIELYEKSGCLRMLSNGAGGLRQQKYLNGAWTPKEQLTTDSQQGWDSWQHGSPQYYKEGNIEQIYMSGAVSNGAGWYSSLHIGVAIPRTPTSFGDCN